MRGGFLYEDSLSNPGFTTASWYSNPVEHIEIFSSHSFSELKTKIESTLVDLERHARQGLFVFGILYYELGYFSEDSLESISSAIDNGTRLCDFFICSVKEELIYHNPSLSDLGNSKILTITPDWSEGEYINKAKQAKHFLSEGESYELNLTFSAKISAIGDPFLLYQKLKRKQRTKCSVYFSKENTHILSLSPETFWTLDSRHINTYPMKGTAKRKFYFQEDLRAAKKLFESEKERAENVMITDLFRNDLGKISEIGSVEVTNLFETHALDSVWQMTSTISAKLLKTISFPDLIKTLFPSGSVTGAPKINSQKLLFQLENRIRGIYSGSLFTLEQKKGELVSNANITIRTLALTTEDDKLIGSYSVGSGITILSDLACEYAECIAKLSFLSAPDVPDFEVLETLRLYQGRYRFLSLHLQRMKRTCLRFGFPYASTKATEALDAIANVSSGLSRVRLLVNHFGDFRAEAFPMARTVKKKKVLLSVSAMPIDNQNIFMYYKTTIRDYYLLQLELAKKLGCEDMILINSGGNVSETCLRNIFYRLEDKWFTPSLMLGGLPGTIREYLMNKGWVVEKDTTLKALYSADEILVGNSLRGLERVNIGEATK